MCFSTHLIKGNFRWLVLFEDRSLIVLVDWVGFEVEELTWKPFKSIFEAAPEFLEEVRKLRVTRAIKARMTSEFRIRL